MDLDASLKSGVLLPIEAGGSQEDGLTMIMDLIASVVSGSVFAAGFDNHYKEMTKPQDMGQCSSSFGRTYS